MTDPGTTDGTTQTEGQTARDVFPEDDGIPEVAQDDSPTLQRAEDPQFQALPGESPTAATAPRKISPQIAACWSVCDSRPREWTTRAPPRTTRRRPSRKTTTPPPSRSVSRSRTTVGRRPGMWDTPVASRRRRSAAELCVTGIF